MIEWPREYTLECDVPGLSPQEISLTYENGVLHLHSPVTPRYAENLRFLRQEYGAGDFDRMIPLGRLAEFVDCDHISAEYELGVLKIRLPKLESAHGKKIAVQSA